MLKNLKVVVFMYKQKEKTKKSIHEKVHTVYVRLILKIFDGRQKTKDLKISLPYLSCSIPR